MAKRFDPYDDYNTPTSFLPEDSAVKNAASSPTAKAAAKATEDAYYTRIVGLTGKTQAQLDQMANARNTAATIREESPTMTSRVDPVTGKVITTPKGTVSGVTGTGGSTSGTTTGRVYTATDGETFTDAQAYATYQASLNAGNTSKALAAQQAKIAEEQKLADRQSAYDLLYNEFNKYGLGGLVEDIKGLIKSNVSPSQFAIELQNTKAYQQRFKANQDRISKGLRALTPAEYIGLEDQYQNIMRNYGLPSSYYAKDTMGTQEGFQKFIANDVSPAELEDRVMMAQDRLISASPDIKKQLSGYYNISEGDILSYILDPQNALNQIKRKVQSAEVGAAAAGAGLDAALNRAEGLVAAGVTGKQYQEAAPFLKEASMRGSELSSFYGMSPYDQNAAEAEAFNLSGSAEAARKRKELTKREQAEFSGAAGTSQGAFDRGRQGAF